MNYRLVAIEDLRIQNRIKNHNLVRSILDGGWGYFAQRLSDKAVEAGREVGRSPIHLKPALVVGRFLRILICRFVGWFVFVGCR